MMIMILFVTKYDTKVHIILHTKVIIYYYLRSLDFIRNSYIIITK